MSTKTPNANEGIDAETETDLDARDARALTEYMSVLPEGGDMYTVVGQHGGTYTVDAREGRCTCPDAEYNLDDDERCKHQRRVAYATGAEAVPAWVDTEAVDDQLGEHVDGGPQVVATDGGRLQRPETDTERTRVPVAGGVLVYEARGVGRELVGFEEVDDWAGVRSALSARGHGVGAAHHLPVLDE
jgi:hypothetical protein